tara:strand:+ start:596 stop:2311 length:1716 start_codon:yes stop_codon:yes gene_type:complete
MDSNKSEKWEYLSKDTFVSLFAYDTDVIEYYEENRTLSGYDGQIYMPSEFLLDVDGNDVLTAKYKTGKLLKILREKDVPYNIYFSGRGFHVGIPDKAFKWKPSNNLHLKLKDELLKHGIFNFADVSVTDKTRIIRLNNTLNTKSRLWKIHLTQDEFNDLSGEEIQELAKRPRRDKSPVKLHCEPVFDIMEREIKKQTAKYQEDIGMNPDPANAPCISTMLEGAVYGSRHATALRIAAWLRWRYPEKVVRLIMEDWRKRVDTQENPFKEEEMNKIVTDCYKGHNGKGYRYGCKDVVMDKYCKSTCKLFKAKKSQTMMNANDMEQTMINWLNSDIKPINLGKIYNTDFPLYPGEVIVLQAPPKCMKTMLVQNWVNELKRPTYFLEMEMAPRQVWQRFIQIEKGWDENQLKDHYMNGQNGISNLFKWLTVDFAPCYPVELERRIDMLPEKPEIVIVDHMGLMLSKHKDLNMKMEEVAGALTELAIKNNIVVIAISEITKSAFSEGMNIASARGSFRIAYNASKLLSIKARKDTNGGILDMIIKTEANREKENLRVMLKPDGVKLKVVEDRIKEV